MTFDLHAHPDDAGSDGEAAAPGGSPVPITPATEEWINEGGSIAPLPGVADPDLTDRPGDAEEIPESDADEFETEAERLSFGRTKKTALLLFTATASILFVIMVIIAQLIY